MHLSHLPFQVHLCPTPLTADLSPTATTHEHLQNRAIKTAVAEQEFWKNASHVRKDLYDVDAVADFWNWLTPFANVVLGSNTAGGMFPDQPGFFYRYFRILGLMRLRQVRVQKVPFTHNPNRHER